MPTPPVPPFHEFAMRYPAFESVVPSRVEMFLQDAADYISAPALGSEKAWRTAVMLKAAHDLVVGGFGSGVEARLNATGLGGFTSVSDGTVSASRPAGGSQGSDLETTSYGRALRHLLRHHLVGVLAMPELVEHPKGSPEFPVRWREE